MNNIESELISLRNVLIKYPKRFELLTEMYMNIEKERQDIQHIIELGKLNAIQMTEMYKELKNVLVERRKIKNELELLSFTKPLYKRKNLDENTINQVLGNVRSLKKKQGNRKYTMKIRKDLEGMIKQ